MLKVGDSLVLPSGMIVRTIRSGVAIRGPREGRVTDTDLSQYLVEVTWEHMLVPTWFDCEELEKKCKRVVGREVVREEQGQKPDLAAARQASSISEALERLGFQVDQDTGYFIRGGVKISFTALAGQTVESFLKLLEECGAL